MKELNIHHTPVFTKNFNAKTRYVINQGGARSSKTMSLCQLMIYKLVSEKNISITVCRHTQRELSHIFKDFWPLLKEYGIYKEDNHNITNNNKYIIPETNSYIEFFGTDKGDKLRGASRDYLWLNEANGIEKSAFDQLKIRTRKQIYMDFNPSDEFHWIYKIIDEQKEKTTFIHSTWRDNTFLDKNVIDELEATYKEDPNFYSVFSLGERGKSQYLVYPNWKEYEIVDKYEDYCYGLDTAMAHPTALIKVYFNENNIYWEEIIYEKGLITTDIINLMENLNIDKSKEMFCDSSDPKSIEELKRRGFNAKECIKGPGSIQAGINYIKSLKLNINSESYNLIKEIRSYKWKEKNGIINIDDNPVKINDDAVDAARYATYSYWYKYKRSNSNDWVIGKKILNTRFHY